MTDLGAKRLSIGHVRKAGSQRPRFGQDPLANEDDFMTRIQLSLGMSPRELANALDVSLSDVVDRHGPRADMSSFITDPLWQRLLNYVDNKIAGYLAIKDELERKRRLDAREHYTRTQKVIRGR